SRLGSQAAMWPNSAPLKAAPGFLTIRITFSHTARASTNRPLVNCAPSTSDKTAQVGLSHRNEAASDGAGAPSSPIRSSPGTRLAASTRAAPAIWLGASNQAGLASAQIDSGSAIGGPRRMHPPPVLGDVPAPCEPRAAACHGVVNELRERA